MAMYPSTIQLDRSLRPQLFDLLFPSAEDPDADGSFMGDPGALEAGPQDAQMIPGPVKEAIYCLCTLTPEQFVAARCNEPAEGTPVLRIGLKEDGEGLQLGLGEKTMGSGKLPPELALKSQELGGFCFGLSRPAHPFVSAVASSWVWMMVDPGVSGHLANFNSAASFLPRRITALVNTIHRHMRESGLALRLLRALRLLVGEHEAYLCASKRGPRPAVAPSSASGPAPPDDAEKGSAPAADADEEQGEPLPPFYNFPGARDLRHSLFQNTRPLVSLLLFVLRGRPGSSSQPGAPDCSSAPDDLLGACARATSSLPRLLLTVKSDKLRASLHSRVSRLVRDGAESKSPRQAAAEAEDLGLGIKALADLLWLSQPSCWTVRASSDGLDHDAAAEAEGERETEGTEKKELEAAVEEEEARDGSSKSDPAPAPVESKDGDTVGSGKEPKKAWDTADEAENLRLDIPFAQVSDYFSYLTQVLLVLYQLVVAWPEMQLAALESSWSGLLDFMNSSVHRLDRRLPDEQGMLSMLLRVAPRVRMDDAEELPAAQGPSNGVPSGLGEARFLGLCANTLVYVVTAATILQHRLLVADLEFSLVSSPEAGAGKPKADRAGAWRPLPGAKPFSELQIDDPRVIGYLRFFLGGHHPNVEASGSNAGLKEAASSLLERFLQPEEDEPSSSSPGGQDTASRALREVCANPLCCMAGSSYRRCGRCRRVYYCSVECQAQHWSGESSLQSGGRLLFQPHKKACRPLVVLA